MPGPSRGRPQVDFENASIKTKKRRVKDLVSTRTSDEMMSAVQLSQRT